MIISSIALTGYRCFNNTTMIPLGQLTALVGSNGCGKSAVLWALMRMFGTSQADRTLERADFHLPPGKEWDDIENASLSIEAVLEFPELADNTKSTDAVAACFRHLTVQEVGLPPYCRIRLTGLWVKSNLPEGDIEQKLLWIASPLGTPPPDEITHLVQGHERSRVHVHYIPASRDPAKQIRNVSGSLLHNLLQAVRWSDDTKQVIAEASDSIRAAFSDESGVQKIRNAIERAWGKLHTAPEHRQVAIRPVARRVAEIIRHVEAAFSPGTPDQESSIEQLSDGQRSLFYLAIVTALFDVQQFVGEDDPEAIDRDKLAPPLLNLLAVEEPENHIAPHYLGRIMSLLQRISRSGRGQVAITSHSASILGRVEPEEVRHLRTQMPERTARASAIMLPNKTDERYKFVREAVRAFPELYFSQFVVLCEGDSEEVVIPRVAAAKGILIDSSFVSVVPLGGRHVNHFWRLLKQLGIPYVTLLDLDREREGGGWGRIKYALSQLLELGAPRHELLAVVNQGRDDVLTDDALASMHTWGNNLENQMSWIHRLEKYNVFFSEPLDLDFMMLQRFPAAYQIAQDGGAGPRIPAEEDPSHHSALDHVTRMVLSDVKDVGSTYSLLERTSFFWYRYLFLTRSKPVGHMLALSRLTEEQLSKGAPPVLTRLVDKLMNTMTSAAERIDD